MLTGMELPNRPSELILMALRDLEVCEKSDRYEITMETWHEPEPGFHKPTSEKICHVCLAGSLMANTMGVHYLSDVSPIYMEDEVLAGKLQSLDAFRMGLITDGIYEFFGKLPDMEWEEDIEDYHWDPEQFKDDMTTLAAKLKQWEQGPGRRFWDKQDGDGEKDENTDGT